MSIVGGDISDQPLSLPKEIQHYYYRTTGLILSCDHETLPVVLNSLRTDMGLQDLVPYFSKFVYQQVRAGTRSLPLLRALIGAEIHQIVHQIVHHIVHQIVHRIVHRIVHQIVHRSVHQIVITLSIKLSQLSYFFIFLFLQIL